jgi:hypothetical protein
VYLSNYSLEFDLQVNQSNKKLLDKLMEISRGKLSSLPQKAIITPLSAARVVESASS